MLYNNFYVFKVLSKAILFLICNLFIVGVCWANEFITDENSVCEIIDTTIEFRFAQEDPTGLCGINLNSEEKLCLKKPSNSYFIVRENIELKLPYDTTKPLDLVPVVKLTESEIEQIKEDNNTVSTQAQILGSLKLWSDFEKAAKSATGETANISPMRGHDMALGYLERQINRWSKKLGPNDPKVLDLKTKLDNRIKDWAYQSSKSDEALYLEVSAVRQSTYNILQDKISASRKTNNVFERAEKAWLSNKWMTTDKPIDCSGKITARKNMILNRDNEMIHSHSGKIVDKTRRSYNWRPKSFYVRSLHFFDDGKYAILMHGGSTGSHSISLGGRPNIALLEKQERKWTVIAVSSKAPVFY